VSKTVERRKIRCHAGPGEQKRQSSISEKKEKAPCRRRSLLWDPGSGILGGTSATGTKAANKREKKNKNYGAPGVITKERRKKKGYRS